MSRIAVLVSGGVDSAVVVDLLKREGHDLHLYYIHISTDNGEGGCTAEEDVELCKLIAAKYDLPLTEVSLHEEYWENVMDYALRTVKEGRTPHPDMMCNKIIKFGFFEERWGKDYDYTATGHYASIKEIGGRKYLATAADPVKDQTDFLAQLSYSQLDHLLFPLGSLPKEEVRRIAREANLPNAGRKDSQGICFLGKINYNDFLRRHLGEKEGSIVDIETGRELGKHHGYWYHTIGQRKGLGLSGGPWFVVGKDVERNVVYVEHSSRQGGGQFGKEILIGEMHWITEDPMEGEEMKVAFKTRHQPHFSHGVLRLLKNNEGKCIGHRLLSEEEVQGIAPGQFAIIYSEDARLCLGSGVILNDEG